MSIVATRAVLGALTLIGIVLLAVGGWFTVNLGTSGSATFTTHPGGDGIVVLEPAVLNRVDDRVSVTARTVEGAQAWVGRATPSDVSALVGATKHVVVDGAKVRTWSLQHHTEGYAAAQGTWAEADIWRQTATAKSRVRVELDQAHAPESLVVLAPAGELSTITLTVERPTWFFQAALAALLGLIALVVGVVGLVGDLRRRRRGEAVQ